ncbi:MAG: ABC transporter permease, partial [Ruminococcus sp.]|nr:ABC transporter permease [Ruminococcus sp.]
MISSEKYERTDMMSILGRLTMRNILRKPMRSFAIIIALAASAFALLFCIAGREAPEQQVREQMLRTYGGAEIFLIAPNCDFTVNKADYPDGTTFFTFTNVEVKAKSPKGEYTATVTKADTKAGKKLSLFDSELDAGKGAIISEAFAEKAGLKKGDAFTVSYTNKNANAKPKTISVKINEISKDKYLRRKPTTIIVSADTFKALTGRTDDHNAFIDVPDDTDAKKLSSDLMAKYAAKEYSFNPVLTDDLLDDLSKQTMVFYLIFAVILLMTLFLTYSMSRHIANERLSAIGTLRSLGGSIPKTSGLLIAESSVYGIVGGILGAVGFLLAGDFAVSAFFGSVGDYSIPVWLYPLTVIFAVLIQIICQSGALIKAVRTPVRDIIFSTRDTAYVLSFKKTLIGAVLLAAGVVVSFFADKTVLSITAISLCCVGSVMVAPVLIKLFSKALVKLFAALGLTTAKFAANECAHKKSTVTSTQLTFIALAITIGVFVTSSAIAAEYSGDYYNYDAVIDIGKKQEQCEKLTKLPEIKEYEMSMSQYLKVTVNGGKERDIQFRAYGDFKLHPIVTGLDGEPAADEIYVGKNLAKKLDVKAGDTIEVIDVLDTILQPDGTQVHPKYTFKIKALCDTAAGHHDTFILNKKYFTENISTYVDDIYVIFSKTGNLEKLKSAVEKDFPNAYVYSGAENKAENDEDCSRIMTIIYSILGVGIVLALLGSVSNAVIGFEQSKRKYAVLHSVAAGKHKLSKLILLETFISSLIASVLAVFLGLFLTTMIDTTLENTGLNIIIKYNAAAIALFVIAFIAV